MLWAIGVILLILWLLRWLCGGWNHSYPAGRCHHLRAGRNYSGTKIIVAIWTFAGEGRGIWKGGGQQVQKDFAEVLGYLE
jgi:hypothetical protein